MAQDNNSQIPSGQEGTTGNDRGMNEGTGIDMDQGTLQTGKVGGEGLPDDYNQATDSSTGAGSAGGPAGDIGGGGGVSRSAEGIGDPVNLNNQEGNAGSEDTSGTDNTQG